MGMTIDEHKEHLLDIMDSMPDDACGDWRDSLAYAIEIMHKYQNIEGIIKVHDAVMMPEDRLYIDRIRKVIENGSTN